ncbi:hypothetical protein ACTPEF_25015, partial [Clostridioides difficile]
MQDKSVREIKEIIETLEVEKYMEYIELLRVDERKSVQGLATGAHKSGRIGEEPNGVPSNLMPYITKIAVGKLKELSVYGNDYP